MQQLFPMFYRLFGARRVQNLISPKLSSLTELPRDSLIHYLSHEEEQPDIDTSKLYLANYTKRILVDYASELKDEKGKPKRNGFVISLLVKHFHLAHRQFRFMKDAYKLTKDPQSLVIMNYSYLDTLYRYAKMPMTKFDKWWNKQKTMWDTINSASLESSRNNFIFITVPKEMISFSYLKLYSTRTTIAMLKIFDNEDKLFILELWKWIDTETRSLSVLSGLSDQALGKVNLVFTCDDGRSAILNLGYLNSWIKGNDNVTDIKGTPQFVPLQLQKLFLKFLVSLQSNVIEETIPDPEAEAIQSTDAKVIDEADVEDIVEVDEDTETSETNNAYMYNVAGKDTVAKVKGDEVIFTADNEEDNLDKDIVDLDEHIKNIDEELKTLDSLASKKLKEKGIHVDTEGEEIAPEPEIEVVISGEEVAKEVFSDPGTDATLKSLIDKAADEGRLSASDYRKYIKQVDEYTVSKDPYGSNMTVTQAMVIKPEDVALDVEKTSITTSALVTDPSMKESSLLSFDKDYISKVINKDMLSMLDTVQKAGVVINKHEIETEHNALGSYDMHTIQLKPIDGQSSTLRFKVPKIDEDGSFLANSNKYQMRKQRVDLPIRKFNPSTVGLTSYYGKTFVTLSQKKANNSVEYIAKYLDKASLEEHPYITKVATAKVFDNAFKAPYIYNALADKYKLIQTNDYTLVFDHTERHSLLPAKTSLFTYEGTVEDPKAVIVGKTKLGELITVDYDNNFFVIKKGLSVPIGNIFDVLKIDEVKAPVDFTEVNVFGKTIPVGIVLGYSIGFNKLLAMLNTLYGCKYRKVEARKSKNLDKDEYAVSFNDVSYIFSRKDRVASLILSGFNEYEKQLKLYVASAFNDKDVYLNLLQSKGLTSIYIREMELTNQLFVDSITKEILVEMKEPTTYNGLLIKATEMLLTYHHPDSQDMSAMRIRGYERISGTVYKELTTAIRAFRNRNISGKSKIDMSPYQVWQSIMKDQSLKLVEDTNPVQNLKESEIVTYVGAGGRAKDAMNKASRAYHVSDMGVISEATVDSADVGVNAYMSANPNFTNLRGLRKEFPTVAPANVVSTSALLAPNSDHDD